MLCFWNRTSTGHAEAALPFGRFQFTYMAYPVYQVMTTKRAEELQ